MLPQDNKSPRVLIPPGFYNRGLICPFAPKESFGPKGGEQNLKVEGFF